MQSALKTVEEVGRGCGVTQALITGSLYVVGDALFHLTKPTSAFQTCTS
jgi:hypothetical protein